MEKRVFFVFIFVILIGLSALIGKNISYIGYAITGTETCIDNTPYGSCNLVSKLYCDNGTLIENCELCGCGDGFTCLNNQCLLASNCADGNGACLNSCPVGSIEFYPLTGSCNVDENNQGLIDISESKTIEIKSVLRNVNPYRILQNINVNFYIEDTSISEGYTLLVLNPSEKYENTITINIPDTLDRSRSYLLKSQINYNDRTLNQDYVIGVNNGTFSYIIKNATFSNNQLVSLGDDLLVNFEIINRRCCLSSNANEKVFYGYCSENNKCLTKPYYCDSNIIVEKCSLCGCSDNYYCDVDDKCKYKVTSEELKKFYEINQVSVNEQQILDMFVRDIPRIPRTPVEPSVVIKENMINVKIENTVIEGAIINNEPSLNINLGS